MSIEKKHQPNDHNAFQDDQSDIQVVASFDDMKLKNLLLRGVYSYGFEKPSAIQQRAILPMINGRDIIAQAQSGTGKTGAFSIGLLERVNFALSSVQALALSPTRELAQQTYEVITQIGKFLMEGCPNACELFIGGTSHAEDIMKINRGAVVIVGTPGRLQFIVSRKTLKLSPELVLILDEADEMFSQGFHAQITEILRRLPETTQIALYSATLPPEIMELVGPLMNSPVRILIKQESLTLEGIKQFYVSLEESDKFSALNDLYESVSIAQSVIFANTRYKVDKISEVLNQNNHTVSHIHASMTKEEREEIMGCFRNGASRVLVTTDLVARGIDVHHVNIVINFDLPLNKENYLHRIGRGGRYGRKGIAINFVSAREVPLLKEIEKHYNTQIEELPVDFATYLSG